jgi:hypothetical protein
VISPRTATKEMLPNVAKFGYDDGFEVHGAGSHDISHVSRTLVDPRKNPSLHSTALHLRMLRARYSGTDSVVEMFETESAPSSCLRLLRLIPTEVGSSAWIVPA